MESILTKAAAFGGFILGIANLGFNVYKEFFIKGEIEVFVEKANVKMIYPGTCDYQIDITLKAIKKDVYIKDIYMIAPAGYFELWGRNETKIFFERAWTLKSEDCLKLSTEQFEELIDRQLSEGIVVRNLKIDRDSYTSITYVGRLEVARLPDGVEDFPVRNWKLMVEYSNGLQTVAYEWEKHLLSLQGYFTTR